MIYRVFLSTAGGSSEEIFFSLPALKKFLQEQESYDVVSMVKGGETMNEDNFVFKEEI